MQCPIASPTSRRGGRPLLTREPRFEHSEPDALAATSTRAEDQQFGEVRARCARAGQPVRSDRELPMVPKTQSQSGEDTPQRAFSPVWWCTM
jgi:hypothetical protein